MPIHILVRKIDVPPGVNLDKEILVNNLPCSLKRFLLKNKECQAGSIQLYFLVRSETCSFLTTAVYFGKHIEIVVQKEDRVIAPFATVREFYLEIVNAIQSHVNSLMEAANAIKAINSNLP